MNFAVPLSNVIKPSLLQKVLKLKLEIYSSNSNAELDQVEFSSNHPQIRSNKVDENAKMGHKMSKFYSNSKFYE